MRYRRNRNTALRYIKKNLNTQRYRKEIKRTPNKRVNSELHCGRYDLDMKAYDFCKASPIRQANFLVDFAFEGTAIKKCERRKKIFYAANFGISAMPHGFSTTTFPFYVRFFIFFMSIIAFLLECLRQTLV